MIRPRFRRALAAAASLVFIISNLSARPIADFFQDDPAWQSASSVVLGEEGASLDATPAVEGEVFFTAGQSERHLRTQQTYSDQIVSFEYLVPKGSESGVFLQGRYEIKLSDSQGDSPSSSSAGAIAGGFNNNTGAAFDAQSPLSDASKTAGDWNEIRLRFRTFRSDEAGNKIANSVFLDITLNGKVVQRDAQIEYYTQGSEMEWEQGDGPLVFRAGEGGLAIRNLRIDHADYEAVVVGQPDEPTNVGDLLDQVAIGKQTFTSLGCIECHTTKKGDTSFKTGPNLYGLFQRNPRKREIVEPATNARFHVDADRSYAKRSIRQPAVELAIAESGPTQGQPYLPVMVTYPEELISDSQVDAIWRYLCTLNEDYARGPIEALVPKGGPVEYNPLEDNMEVLVAERTRIQRGSMAGVSGRSIHVGQTNGVNYTFDPRTLSIEKLWQGGFVNGAGEWQNRGGGGFAPGYESKEINLGGKGGLLAPLNGDGATIDFSFKEAIYGDWDTIDASLNNSQDHLDLLAEIDAQFKGYTLDSSIEDATPVFKFRIGENLIAVQTTFTSEGAVTFHLTGSLKTPQSFSLNDAALSEFTATSGSVTNSVWTLPAGETLDATLSAKIGLASLVWRPEQPDTDFETQDLVVEATEANLPAGYRSEQFLPPVDNFGRDLLFEATGIDVAPDGTIVVGTRTAGIWRLKDGKWSLFAEGLFDCLGLVVEDESGLQIVAGQKPELTRISDTDGDGRADSFETLADQFSYHSNYHSYMHGPIRDQAGNYYFLLNLLHADNAIYKGRGLYMGTSGGFAGWAIKVTPEGEFIPWASGLRSPASLGIDAEGQIWYAENQGEYVGTSKLFKLDEGKFYGHPATLIDSPGMQPDSPEIQWPASGEGKERAIALFPHNRVANSPGHMTWDTTESKFGPFAGQMFIGDQTQSKLLRVATFQIHGKERAAVFPFGNQLQSGLMRPVFLPDGSLLIGQTGRGWHAQGGKIASLQRIVWDGETIPQSLLTATLSDDALQIELSLTQALAAELDSDTIKSGLTLSSWMYRDAPDYGSPELDIVEHEILDTQISDDRKTITVSLKESEFGAHEFQTARVYYLKLTQPVELEAYITGE